MHCRPHVLAIVVVVGAALQSDVAAQAPTSGIKVCELLPRAEVKRLINGLCHNPAGYAELYVRIDKRFLTLQREIDSGQTGASVRPGVIALATALGGRLR
jgi:hypothetical protein